MDRYTYQDGAVEELLLRAGWGDQTPPQRSKARRQRLVVVCCCGLLHVVARVERRHLVTTKVAFDVGCWPASLL